MFIKYKSKYINTDDISSFERSNREIIFSMKNGDTVKLYVRAVYDREALIADLERHLRVVDLERPEEEPIPSCPEDCVNISRSNPSQLGWPCAICMRYSKDTDAEDKYEPVIDEDDVLAVDSPAEEGCPDDCYYKTGSDLRTCNWCCRSSGHEDDMDHYTKASVFRSGPAHVEVIDVEKDEGEVEEDKPKGELLDLRKGLTDLNEELPWTFCDKCMHQDDCKSPVTETEKELSEECRKEEGFNFVTIKREMEAGNEN